MRTSSSGWSLPASKRLVVVGVRAHTLSNEIPFFFSLLFFDLCEKKLKSVEKVKQPLAFFHKGTCPLLRTRDEAQVHPPPLFQP